MNVRYGEQGNLVGFLRPSLESVTVLKIVTYQFLTGYLTIISSKLFEIEEINQKFVKK